MKVRIITELSRVGYWVAAKLEQAGHQVEITEGKNGFRIIHSDVVTATELAKLQGLIDPFSLPISKGNVNDVDLEICLSTETEDRDLDIMLVSPDDDHLAVLTAELGDLGLKIEDSKKGYFEKNIMLHCDGSSYHRQLVRWLLLQHGLRVSEKCENSLSSGAIAIAVKPENFNTTDLGFRIPIIIRCDDLTVAGNLADQLTESGFEKVQVQLLSQELASKEKNHIKASSIVRLGNYRLLELLKTQTHSILLDSGVDIEAYPLHLDTKFDLDEPEELITEIVLPVDACTNDKSVPYAGDITKRFFVRILGDSQEGVTDLLHQLRIDGFRDVRFENTPIGQLEGFAVRWKSAGLERNVSNRIRSAVSECLTINEIPTCFDTQYLEGESKLSLSGESSEFKQDEIRIELPLVEALDGSLIDRLGSGEKYSLHWHADNFDNWEGQLDVFDIYGFEKIRQRGPRSEPPWTIMYGGANQFFLDRFSSELRERFSATPRLKKAWNDTDMDIYVYLPDEPPDSLVKKSTPTENYTFEPGLDAWMSSSTPKLVKRPFISILDGQLWVGPVRLARRSGNPSALVPDLKLFKHLCIDQPTAQTLVHIARSVDLCEPCMLEGETSTSKTSTVLLLASLLGQPVVRINLNGQTDTGELIGRYVPGEEDNSLPYSVKELLDSAERLSPTSLAILNAADRENRPLTPLEVQQVKSAEHFPVRQWRWQDGLIPQAMRCGWILLLDECNLAEPQILERINSVLEQNPTLVLTEHDNSVIGTGGEEVHPDFRIFATMNPAEYAGRSELSPAYRDRWRAYRFITPAGEVQYLDMLRYLVFGRAPDIVIEGCEYRMEDGEPHYPLLANILHMDQFLEALARFHAGLEQAAGQGGGTARLGARRREPYVFTRRGMLSFLDFINKMLTESDCDDPYEPVRQGLLRYYAGRMTTEEDRRTLVQLLDAVGIGPSVWTIGGQEYVKASESEEAVYGVANTASV
ncbi:MAG: AAA family ATPase [Candidatus Thiodiazotropha endolucinida]|nr:AAA family ATPase [Candidatus Thiodiazotropha taylori]MCW4311970.1 AAA family ATPase [Candidatus Thiodiazotropha taylori]